MHLFFFGGGEEEGGVVNVLQKKKLNACQIRSDLFDFSVLAKETKNFVS